MATVRATRVRVTGLVVTATLVLLGGCGDDGSPATDASTDVSTGASTDQSIDVSTEEGSGVRQPAGTALADGLTVPEGAELAGTVFADPDPMDDGSPGGSAADGWLALLVVVGDDPFAVFDSLGEQVRSAGPAMPGTADSCSWVLAVDEHVETGPRVAVDGPPPPVGAVDRLECEATARDGERSFTVRLDWGGDRTGTLMVSGARGGRDFTIGSRGQPYDEWADPDEEAPPTPDCAAVGCEDDPADAAPTTHQPRDTLPETGPEPVPAAALDLLPDRPEREAPDVEEPFGGESGCFSTTRDRFRLPDGAVLAGSVGGYDATWVLAVDDIDGAIEALVAQAAEADPAGVYGGEIEDRALDDGTAVRHTTLQGNAGGACRFLGSRDGRHLLVSMGPD